VINFRRSPFQTPPTTLAPALDDDPLPLNAPSRALWIGNVRLDQFMQHIFSLSLSLARSDC
jgi:hypothetical protein